MDDEAFDILTSDGESEIEFMSLDIDELKEAISCLANNHWQRPDELPKSHKVVRSYNLLKLALAIGMSKERETIDRIISKQYRPIKISERTVGSFLFGCQQKDYGDTEKDCSPICIGGMGHGKCKYQVWNEEGEYPRRFIRINVPEVDDGTAYIYTKSTFTGFSDHELKDFEKAGVKRLQVFTTRDTSYVLEVPLIEITSLQPEIKAVKGQEEEEKVPVLLEKDNTFLYVIIALLIGVVIYLVLNR